MRHEQTLSRPKRNQVADRKRPVAARAYGAEADRLAEAAARRLSPAARELLENAQSESRALDDDHVGTEHVVLGLFALGAGAAYAALASLGISRQLFLDQLDFEAGPSPEGRIPLTPRARRILGLAGLVATERGAALVEPEDILLGVVRESEIWARTGEVGPHHLRSAAEAAGTSLSAIVQRVVGNR
jgi:ATP-dependent Clp protease ATP-binding subunit ClpA